MSFPHTHPELLAPAGDWECVRAAVANGADAVYFGLPKFNARLRAENFTEEELPALMDWLHARGVKGFVAFNTLVFPSEIPAALEQLRWITTCGVDAVIVQDVGLVRLARELFPSLEIHASTQMTLTSPEGMRFAKELGIARVVLARELSLRDLERFQQMPEADRLPIEVFVHGALCVAYSGQCLTSEALGRRSANRGECAQACRMPYEMVVDGEIHDLGDRRYLLSPQDLAAAEWIPGLLKLGVMSFKIEGRLKSPEYVAAVTAVYRRALDAAMVNAGIQHHKVTAGERYAMEMTFSRGLFTGWVEGVNHQRLVDGRYGKKRGPFVGQVVAVGRQGVTVDAKIALKAGDGVVFDTGEDTNKEQGGRIFSVDNGVLGFQHGRLDFRKIPVGCRVWKTDDPQLTREIRRTFEKEPPPRRAALDFVVRGEPGKGLSITGRNEGREVTVISEIPLQIANKQPLTVERLREQLGRLGETPFELGNLDCVLEGELILPIAELNRLRRELVAALSSGEEKPAPRPAGKVEIRPLHAAAEQHAGPMQPEITVLCRSLEQTHAALAAGVGTVYLDFEDVRRYREAVEQIRAHGNSKVFLATPRIQKPGEQGFFRLVENAGPDGVLIRNLGGIEFFANSPLRKRGDFSLNVANPYTAEFFMEKGLETLTISYDLNAAQVLDLLAGAPPSWFELTIHQQIPMFHMEHCVFAAFLSEGTDHTNCGRPCDHHRVALRDRVGMEHPVMADVGCRNTVFNAVPQTGALYFEGLVEAGLRRFRVDLLRQNDEETTTILNQYHRLMSGDLAGDSLWRRLNANSQLGVTRGTSLV